ncbi:MAG TPA: zf-HC2 domain-containing protein, partial [Acidobacteriota bacterium]|nr:zf-HC2 domain-containing protein [Acidobacteriota bacterium]
MRCRAIERLLLAAEDRAWTAAEKQAVEAHVADCPACREFQGARQRMRAGLADLWRGEPPDTLSAKTRKVCLDATRRGLESPVGSRLPAPVAAASILFS